jgi:hypothetical protein
MKNFLKKSGLFLIVLVFAGNIIFTAETVDVKGHIQDVEFEQRCDAVKINALLQRHVLEDRVNAAQIDFSTHFIAHNCSYYAIYFAHLLAVILEDLDDFDFKLDDAHENPFQSEQVFQNFLAEFELTEDFDFVDLWAVPSDQVKEIAAKVNPKIIPISFNDDIKKFLSNYSDYQVFIFNKNDHWVACGIDYRTDKIYFVDSLKNYKKQKYSKLDRGIISTIRAGMLALKDFAGAAEVKDFSNTPTDDSDGDAGGGGSAD